MTLFSPPRTRPGEPSTHQLLRARDSLRRILTENIVPFWYPAAIDEREGGYRRNMNGGGRWGERQKKDLVSQARTLWFFARLAQSEHGAREHLAAARHGYEFLRRRMLDERFGGVYWEADSSGRRAINSDKYSYAQAFAIYALSEYARACEDPSPRALARQLFDVLEERAYDPEWGGYRDFSKRDRSPAMDVERKSLGAHVHLMEAMSSLYLVTGDPIVRERLVQLIVINSNAVVRKRVGACTDEHQQDWTPLRGDEHDRVCSGHDVKNVWLLIRACEAAGLPNWPLLDLYRTLFQSALNYGFDQEWGGFYESGPLNAPADRRQKVGWVQAEALLSALHMYRLAGDRLYLTCFTRTLDWVTSRQVDWRRGDWYSRVLESGNPAVGGASMALEGPYHQARAMIECLDLLPTPAEPEAGVDGAD